MSLDFLQVPPSLTRADSRESDRTLAESTSITPLAKCISKDGCFLRNRSPSPSSDTSMCKDSKVSSLRIDVPEMDVTSVRHLAGGLEDHRLASYRPAVACPSHTNLAIPDARLVAHHGAVAQFKTPPPPNVVPTTPQHVLEYRYNTRPRLSEEIPAEYEKREIPAMQRSYERTPLPYEHWTPMAHPEGQLYYRKTDEHGICLYTDSVLHYDDNLRDTDVVTSYLSQEVLARKKSQMLPADVEITIHVESDNSDVDAAPTYSYYLSSKSERNIMWMENVDVELISLNLRPICDLSYLKLGLLIGAICRMHVSLYPDARPVTRELLHEVNAYIYIAAFDTTTSRSSTSPYAYQDLSAFSVIFQNLRVDGSSADMWIIARMLHIFCESARRWVYNTVVSIEHFQDWEKFLHLHGHPEARLDREKSVFDKIGRSRPGMFSFVSILLFNMPDRYLDELGKVWVDQTVNHVPWQNFVSGLQKDWVNSITPAAVLLTANGGLLTVNTIDTDGPRNVAEIACYISTFLCLGTIILCTILTRQHQTSGLDTASGASEYLWRRATMKAGLEFIAITFSLPSAFFLWGMVTFYIAMGWVCFDRSNIWTRLLTGLFFTLVTLLTAAVICVELWPTDSNTYSVWDRFLTSIRNGLRAKAHMPKLLKGIKWRSPIRRDTKSQSNSPV